jgi:hypothetical protein
VLQKVIVAVKRWRWLRIEESCPQLAANGAGRGALIEPIWQLLNTRATDDSWTEKHKAGLRSAMAGRQFTQTRVKRCGWSGHDRCLACLSRIVDSESPQAGSKRTARDPVNATEEQIARAPVGNLSHRLWTGECLRPSRMERARKEDLVVTRTCEVAGHPAWERGLSVRPPLPKRRQSKVETFNWYLKPAALPLQGDVYPDGSYLDGIVIETGRCGWAFVVIGGDGNIAAAAYGVPPPWIQDIGGAEAWATYQAMLVTIPSQCRYWPDCLPVHLAVQKGG